MNSFKVNSPLDEIEKIIYKDGLRINAIHFHKDVDLMLIILNNKKVISRLISEFTRLRKATEKQLNNYKLIGKGTGIHWPDVDEDLSLKGFLKHEMICSLQNSQLNLKV
ncbi:MAG: DUF2442 domain-containing protein [Bacteroidia bacterium]|nr:DUF2442 domain-containing protein [Bacteroidia bacterium]